MLSHAKCSECHGRGAMESVLHEAHVTYSKSRGSFSHARHIEYRVAPSHTRDTQKIA